MILLVPVVWSFHLTPQVVKANLQQSTDDSWRLVAQVAVIRYTGWPLYTDKVAFPDRWSLKTGVPS